MANVGVVDIPDAKKWVKHMKSALAIRHTGPSQATTDRGVITIIKIKKRKIS